MTALDEMTTPLSQNRDDAAAGGEWWRYAVIYQVYPRSFADSDGDGMGDLPGITAKLGHLAELGVDAVWLSPFYTSPQCDAGYDVADYRDVDKLFGVLADADAMLVEARRLGLRVIVDLVPNHTSSEHEWFGQALAAPPGSRERDRYMFRPGKGENGDLPPNDWRSVFGGPAWSRVPSPNDAGSNDAGSNGAETGGDEWYLHLFDVEQPDLNWRNPEVRAEMESVLRFWLDRGVDGFRVDVAHGLIKAEGLPDHSAEQEMLEGADGGQKANGGTGGGASGTTPFWDQDGVHEIYRSWREVLDSYPDDRMAVAEAWVHRPERLVRYIRPDELHQAFNFDYLQAPWRAQDLRAVAIASMAANDSVGAPTTWVLSNHDVIRHATRLGYPVDTKLPKGIGVDDAQPDTELGLRRARAATLLMLALPGSAYLYQGEELGLPEHTTLDDGARQDPTWFRTRRTVRGRDGCRVPIPWEADAPSLGFGPSQASWLPQPEEYREYALDLQLGVPGSTLEMYRDALRLRRERTLGAGLLEWDDAFGVDVVAFRSSPLPGDPVGESSTGGSTLVLANLGPEPVTLPEGARVLLSSTDPDSGGRVPTDVTVWATLSR